MISSAGRRRSTHEARATAGGGTIELAAFAAECGPNAATDARAIAAARISACRFELLPSDFDGSFMVAVVEAFIVFSIPGGCAPNSALSTT